MKFDSVQAALFSLVAAATAALPTPAARAEAGSTNAVGPRIQFASTVYDFGKVMVGVQVRNVFVFTNTGDAVLEIKGVYPSCGCTTAGVWSHQVEPGMTGVIPLAFNSAHFAGPVAKSANVICNDSGPLHLAAALKVKTLGLFGPTDPQLFGPYPLNSPTNHVVQAPVGDLRLLTARDVYARFARLDAISHGQSPPGSASPWPRRMAP